MINIILQEIASILIFFYAIGRFSNIIMRIESKKLKYYISKVTKTPIRSILFGTFSSGLIQSHKAVSVITLTMVNAGALTAISSIPLLISTTLGASSTAFLVSMKWESMEECLIIIGAILKKIKKSSNVGHIIFYLGLLLFGLELMSNATSLLKDNKSFQQIFSFTDNVIILFLVGCILAFILQAAALFLSMLTILITYNSISMYNAMCITTGVTVGATLSLAIVIISMNNEAKKACYINMALITICGILSLFFVPLLTKIGLMFETKQFGFAVANAISRIIISVFSMILFFIMYKTKYLVKFFNKH